MKRPGKAKRTDEAERMVETERLEEVKRTAGTERLNGAENPEKEGSSATKKADRPAGWRRLLKLKRLWLLLLLPAALLSLFAASRSQEIAEHVFARGIFVVLSWMMSHITSLLPFSLMEFGIVVLPFALLFLLVWFIVRLVRKKEDRAFRLAKAFLNAGCIVSAAAFLLIVGCSVNYYRYPVSQYLDLTVEPAAKEELYDLVRALAEETSRVREKLAQAGLEDENGVYALSMTKRGLGREAVKAFGRLAEEYPIFGGYCPQPKHIFFSRTMSRTELTGIFCPFTMEANVNIDVPHYSLGSTMCHELAHLKGFIREDEANYIAFLVCMASDSDELRYSGLMEALILAGNALYRKDADLYREACSLYSEGVSKDLGANREYWAQFENTVISNTAEKLNDTYLKANNQEDGVQSYGRMVDLLLAQYRRDGGESIQKR
ncbi:MAG: DUF3810 domain-containing protein [Lachnospiraceae bacterium]|nr:DUF3810 domain-containing protein [Lachnospiraceae bacterium]